VAREPQVAYPCSMGKYATTVSDERNL
jgi:hypothetical protein